MTMTMMKTTMTTMMTTMKTKTMHHSPSMSPHHLFSPSIEMIPYFETSCYTTPIIMMVVVEDYYTEITMELFWSYFFFFSSFG